MTSVQIFEVPLDLFSSSPEAARELLVRLFPTASHLENTNYWLSLVEIASNKVLKFCLTDKNEYLAEAWLDIISELAKKLNDTPIRFDVRQSMISAASILIFSHGMDCAKKTRNPSWWVEDFMDRYDCMFEQLSSAIANNFCDYDFDVFQGVMGELDAVAPMSKYHLNKETKSRFDKWIKLCNSTKSNVE